MHSDAPDGTVEPRRLPKQWLSRIQPGQTFVRYAFDVPPDVQLCFMNPSDLAAHIIWLGFSCCSHSGLLLAQGL